MWNPTLPYNELPFLPPQVDLESVAILKAVNKANIALAQLNGSAHSIPARHLLIQPLSIREAVASSGIENINTTIEEALQAAVLPEEDIPKNQKETLHYSDALLCGYELIVKKGFLSTNSFLEIQKLLEPNKPGVRKLSGVKIANLTTSEVLYTPPEGEGHIRNLLKNYEEYFNSFEEDMDPLIRMAVLHYQFEAIHPFYDGNGRTGRILMLLYLILAKRLDLPILFISAYINDHRSSYYSLLNAVTRNDEWENWVLFVLEAVKVQAEVTAQLVDRIRSLMNKTREDLRNNMPELYSADLVEFLFSHPFYTQESLSGRLKVHRNTSSKYLNALVEGNYLIVFKQKKQKIYCNPAFLKLLV